MRKALIALIALWVCTATVQAQETPGSDPISAAIIPPDVVMAHQQELGLSAAQRAAIEAAAQSAQQRFLPLQWQLSAATEKLAGLLRQTHVDESKALAQLNAVLDIERRIKRTQITLMIDVKNELTPEQQATAHRIAAASRH